jgi:hypothetical protein
MVVILPREYIVQKFYQYAGYPRFKKITNVYEAGCPICREGSSWGKKRRCYYVVEKNNICCHNCGWFSNPFKWIETVACLTPKEIFDESKSFDILPLDLLLDKPEVKKIIPVNKLPKDSINLFDKQQLTYYKDNPIVKEALKLIVKRKLHTAINKPQTLWISLVDKVHKNRLIIPFYDQNNDIIFYQSRTILNDSLKYYPKYLSKVNSEKSLYNINNISSDLEYIFIFEGPIDSFFIKNGTAVAGIQENSSANFTKLQADQLGNFKLFKKVWFLDSQWNDLASRKKTMRLIEGGETVFIWPEKMGKEFKDLNEYCIASNTNSLDTDFVIQNSFSDIKAKLLMIEISRWKK